MLFIPSLPDRSRRHTTNDRIGHNILRHHRSSCYHRTIANSHIFQNDRIRRYPDIIPYDDSPFSHALVVDQHSGLIENMIIRA